MPGSWLVVERLENWRVDRSEGFRSFGLPQRYASRATDILPGAKVFVYVSSGVSAFADIREVVEGGVVKLRFGGNYDTGFPIAIRTRPLVTLEQDQWVSVKEVKDRLSFLRDKSDWRQSLRTSIRRLKDEDAAVLLGVMQNAQTRSL